MLQETQRIEDVAGLSKKALEDHQLLTAAQDALPGALAPLLQALHMHQADSSPEQQQRRRRPQPSRMKGTPKEATAGTLRDAAALVAAAAQHATVAEKEVLMVPLSHLRVK